MGSKIDYLSGFCYCCVMTTSAHTDAYHYPLLESGSVNSHFMQVRI